jgi:hypothetical protein
MIGFLAHDVRVNKMVKTKNRYTPPNVGQVGHFWTPKIHGNPSNHGGALDRSRHFMHIFKVVDNVGYMDVLDPNHKQEGPSDSNYRCIKAQDKTRTEHIRTRTSL